MNNHKHQEHETEFYFTVNVVHCQTSLSVLIVGPKCTPVTLCAAPRWVCRWDRETDRRTDDRPLHYAFRYGRGQRNNL